MERQNKSSFGRERRGSDWSWEDVNGPRYTDLSLLDCDLLFLASRLSPHSSGDPLTWDLLTANFYSSISRASLPVTSSGKPSMNL